MQSYVDLKNLALISENDPMHLQAYDPDNLKSYEVLSDVKSLKLLLNLDPYNNGHSRASFTAYQTYLFIKQMTDEQVDAILTSSYFMLPARIKEENRIKFQVIKGRSKNGRA